jgi:hypothetical protein
VNATLMWQSIPFPGTEHFVIRVGAAAIEAEGFVVSLDSRPIRLHYRIRCDPDWTARELDITEASSGLDLGFRSDGQGRWTDREGRHLPDLDGCVDVDVAATPLTNTLPIRRLTWDVGQVRELRMVYFLVPELTIECAGQRYTCLTQDGDGATFRYESGGFTADIRVDRDGFVIDYPGIWRRIWPETVA